MSIPFQDSETAKNLLRAFAGESQAGTAMTLPPTSARSRNYRRWPLSSKPQPSRNRPTPRFSGTICKPLNGQNLPIYGAYPIEGTNRILELLRAAQHNEHEEHGSVYPSFAAIATQEGFPGGRRLLPADCRH